MIPPELLHLAATAGALESGFTPGHVDADTMRAAAQIVDRQRPPRGRPWTRKEVRFLRQNVGWLSPAEIARALGRTPTAVRIQQKRRSIPAQRHNPDLMNGREMGRALGIDSHRITHLFKLGVMPGRVMPEERGHYICRRKDFIRWCVNPENWPYIIRPIWNTSRIADPHLRRLIELRKERWGDEWLDSLRIAEMYGLVSGSVPTVIQKRNMPAVKIGSRWYMKRSVAEQQRWFAGKGSANLSLPMSDALDTFLITGRALGIGWAMLDKMLGVPEELKRSYYFMWRIQKGKGVVATIEQHNLEVYQRKGGKVLFADWRQHRDRFPGVAQAIDRFLNGRRMTEVQRNYVQATLYTWAQWHATTKAQRRHMRPFKFKWNRDRGMLWGFYREILSWGIDPLGGES